MSKSKTIGGVQWCDRHLFLGPIYYTICTDEKKFQAQLKHMNIGEFLEPTQGCDFARTHFLYNSLGDEVAIVCLFPGEHSLEASYGLIAHEAIHIWQHTLENIGEENPGKEMEAYCVQTIFVELVHEFNRQLKIKLPKANNEKD